MSDFSLNLEVQFKRQANSHGMTKIAIKSENVTPFGGIFSIYTYRCILTHDYESTPRQVVEFYNLRGGKERIFDEMNNGFGWAHIPKSFMAENAVFLLITALIRNFYKKLMQDKGIKVLKRFLWVRGRYRL